MIALIVSQDVSKLEPEVCRVVKADHDYLELMVKVKEEIKEEEEQEEVISDPESKSQISNEFFNLAQLADVSLAAEGKSEDKVLSEQIRRAREATHNKPPLFIPIGNPIHNANASSVGPRTMQIVVPDNASHIIICTNNNNGSSNGIVSPNATSEVKVSRPGGHKKSKPHTYNCIDCGKKYSTSSNLARHRQTHRSVDQGSRRKSLKLSYFRSLEDKKAKKCPYCGKVYVSMPAFSMHLRTHNQTCKCNICGKAFSRPWLLQGHIRTHTGNIKISS